ncbi:DUF2336 domain-containing protein [Methylobacterium sp. Leaf108]|uniref:DUF2336 domain-containing protein n=1 Tax=Methylobacterium sp. Leaf108 TaxID=1736256 RepID=UPI0006F93D76|nr:DUF2336 domain-containing protein [Methylobacterium sp. Leaf108]KQP52731.1 hypothetical protein ASF39_07520 [Methylobacterium sp. Leaf108]
MSSSLDDAPDLSGLIELARVEHLDLKPVILRVQTDLFVSTETRDPRTVAAFEALAGGLIPTVDDATAETVARKLAPFPGTPSSVLARLAARGGAIRDIVIAQAAVLNAEILDAAVADRADLGPAIAARPDLSRHVLADLATRAVPGIDKALAANTRVALQGEVLRRLVDRARHDADLAAEILQRPDLSPADLAPLFLFASPEVREEIASAVASTAALRPCPPAPREAGAILTGFSGRRDIAGFVGALSDLLGLPKGFLASVPDPSRRYELLTLALRAAGLHEEEAVYVFLTLNESVARSVDRVYDLVRLFRTTGRPAARDLIAAIIDAPVAERTGAAEAHQAYHAPDAARSRSAAVERPSIRPVLPSRVRKQS